MDSHSNLQVPNCGPFAAFWPCASSDSLWSWQFELHQKGAANRPQPTPYQFCGLSPQQRQWPDRIADFPVWSWVFLMQGLPVVLLPHKMFKSCIKIIWLGSKVLVGMMLFFWFEVHTWSLTSLLFNLMFPNYSQRQKRLTQNNWQFDRHPGRCPCGAVTLAQPRGSNLSSTSAVASTIKETNFRPSWTSWAYRRVKSCRWCQNSMSSRSSTTQGFEKRGKEEELKRKRKEKERKERGTKRGKRKEEEVAPLIPDGERKKKGRGKERRTRKGLLVV